MSRIISLRNRDVIINESSKVIFNNSRLRCIIVASSTGCQCQKLVSKEEALLGGIRCTWHIKTLQKRVQARRQEGRIHNVDGASTTSNPFVVLWRWLSFQEYMAPMCSGCIAEIEKIECAIRYPAQENAVE